MNTNQYRIREFKKVSGRHTVYKPKIKIINVNGETNWLDIYDYELENIEEYLTGGKNEI